MTTLHTGETFIPPAVRAAAARAAEMQKQMYAPQNAVSQETPAPEPRVEATPKGNAPQEAPQKEAPQKEASQKEPPQQEPKDQPHQGDIPYEELRNRYESQLGRVRNLMRELSELKRNSQGAENEIATLRAQVSELSARLNAVTTPVSGGLVTEEERRDFGDELLTVVGKKAVETLTPELTRAYREIEALKAQVSKIDSTSRMSAEDIMLRNLDARIPQWRAMNSDKRFLTWLYEQDPLSGQTRVDLLDKAYAENSADRVAAFFEGFLRETGSLAPKRPEGDQRPQTGAKVSLQDLAAPGKAMPAAASAPAAPEAPEGFTRSEISQFYADRRAGKYAKRQKEADDLERRIVAAIRDGRVFDIPPRS